MYRLAGAFGPPALTSSSNGNCSSSIPLTNFLSYDFSLVTFEIVIVFVALYKV